MEYIGTLYYLHNFSINPKYAKIKSLLKNNTQLFSLFLSFVISQTKEKKENDPF